MKSFAPKPGREIQILDCTFRDGGYYNNWDFSDSVFEEYLSAVASSNVDLLEVGFRLPVKRGFRGAHAYTTDDYLASFDLPARKKFGVMINASDFGASKTLAKDLQGLFNLANESAIDFVRIASHGSEVDLSIEIASLLLDLGYEAAVNLMQMSEIDDFALREHAGKLSKLPLFSLYLADSLGSMKPEGIRRKISVMTESTHLPIGLHAHDNLGLAFENSMVAIEAGATYVDGTVRGMGRGPGNTKTEELAMALGNTGAEFEGALQIGRLSEGTWSGLQQELGWGRNLAYFTAGLLKVHPTYVQELLADSRHDSVSALHVVRELSEIGAQRFDKDRLSNLSELAEPNYSHQENGDRFSDWTPEQFDEVVILGPGQTLRRHRRSLSIFCSRREKAAVLSVNDASLEHQNPHSYHVVSHRRQVGRIEHLFKDPSCRIILPAMRLERYLPSQISASCLDLPFLDAPRFEIGQNQVLSPVDNVFAYACGIANMSGAKRIFMAGFDGIGGGDSRDFEMVEILSQLRQSWGLEFLSLTPTSIPVEVASPFSLRGSNLES